MTTARSFGVEAELLSAEEAARMWPLMSTRGILGAAYFPNDGHAQPSDLTQALAKGARSRGVQIVEGVSVESIDAVGGCVTGVRTDQGEIRAERVVVCAGMWTRNLLERLGAAVPLQPMQHQYAVTDVIEGVERGIPTLRDPDGLVYFKEDVGGLAMGGYERRPLPWSVDEIPQGFQFSLLDSNYEQFEPLMESAMARVPALESAGVQQLINGPESFTPDGNFILGELPSFEHLFVGAGFNAYGIAAAGGAGWALAAWVAEGRQPMDLAVVDVRRFGPPHRSRQWVRERTIEETGKHYTISWPGEEHDSTRPERTSPVYHRLRAAGACFGEKFGWERPNWFARSGEQPLERYSFGRPNWFDRVGDEHAACRGNVALFDQSSFAKFMVAGGDAADAMSWICANDVTGDPGTVTYTQMLNPRGGIECDLTVSRLSRDVFYVVTGTAAATRDADWIRRSIPAGACAALTDVTSAYGVLSVMGPRSRELLGEVAAGRLDNAAFPFGAWRTLEIGGASLRAMRVTYVGELGWELHIPAEYTLAVYDRLVAAGGRHDLTLAGYRAIESLRLEKGYRAWGSDVTPDETPLEAGLAFAVKLRSGLSFQGREALQEQRGGPLPKRFACFTVDDPAVALHGRETIYRNGEIAGYLTSAGWGYTIGRSIGYGYVGATQGVSKSYVASGAYELEVAMERMPCTVHLRPLYDPDMARVKG